LPGTLLIVVGIQIFVASPADGGTPQAAAPHPAAPHVRAEARDVRQFIQDAMEASATARRLVERLQQSDLIVYVRFKVFPASGLDGRVGLLAAVPRHRFLVIELACGRSRLVQMATLAHELHHAVEIADAPAIVDARSLSAHYSRIGIRMSADPTSEMFETVAARETAAETRREILTGTARITRTVHDRD
jgi:hypothetical protein